MAPLQVTESHGVKVYNVSSGKTLPQWLSEKKKKSLRKDEEYKSRIELIQDFEFDVASQRLRISRDGKFLAATGVYPPQVKVYEVGELSMKFERHMDCEVVQFDILSDDYSKMVFLQADRTVELHAKFGTYYKTRIPKTGRDMVYDPVSCDLIIGGSSSDVYRLNLEQGRFLKPYSVLSEAVNCLDRSAMHGLIAMGTEVLGRRPSTRTPPPGCTPPLRRYQTQATECPFSLTRPGPLSAGTPEAAGAPGSLTWPRPFRMAWAPG